MRPLRLLVLLLVLLVPRVAPAQDDAARRALAKHHVAEGLRAQDAGRYDQAIAHYQEAYRLVPHPEILFNLGQAYRLGGDDDNALVYYRRYLAADPDGRVVDDARRWVAELEAAIAVRDQAAAAAEARAAAARPPPDRGRPLRIAGLASGAAGVISIGVAVKFGFDARGISDDLSQQDGAWTDAILARQDEGRRAERTMFVCAGIGAVAVIAGGVLYAIGHRSAPEGAIVVGPILDGDTTGVAAVGRF